MTSWLFNFLDSFLRIKWLFLRLNLSILKDRQYFLIRVDTFKDRSRTLFQRSVTPTFKVKGSFLNFRSTLFSGDLSKINKASFASAFYFQMSMQLFQFRRPHFLDKVIFLFSRSRLHFLSSWLNFLKSKRLFSITVALFKIMISMAQLL